MAEYITKEAAICLADYAADEHPYSKEPGKPETYSDYNQGWNDGCDYIRARLEEMPAADVAPVVHGRWVDAGRGIKACSNCNHGIKEHMACANHYCPNRGAKMDGGGTE